MVDDSASTSGEDIALQPVSVGVRSRRRALWGVLAAIIAVTGAVVVSSGGDGGPPRLPVALGSSGGREAATASTSADMMLAWVTYIAGDGLPGLGGEAAAYRLTGAVDAGRVRALAASLGLKGDPTHEGRLWHLQSGDAVLEVYEESGGGWWYSPQAGVVSSGGSTSGGGSAGCDPTATECAGSGTGTVGPATTIPGDACAKDGSVCSSPPTPSECPQNAQCATTTIVCPAGAACAVPDCPPNADCALPPPTEPVPPADLPSKAEARTIALDLLTATGMDVADAKVTVEGPYDAWYVTVEPRLDGVPVTGWVSSVGVGSKGVVMSASGTLGTPERLGSYPLLDTRAAIDRLNKLQGQYGGGYGGGPVPMGAPYPAARDSGVATADAPMPTTPCSPDDPSCAPLVSSVGPPTTVTSQCKVQPDGTEVCETTGVDSVPPGGGPVECLTPSAEPGTDPAIAVPTTTCGPVGICNDTVPSAPTDGAETTLAPSPECQPPVPPEPVEVTLTKAEPVLTPLPASDGSGDVYLVPGYRFSNVDGVVVDVAAVADDSLAPTTTVPDTTNSSAVTPPSKCETLVEGDGSGTTHTIQTCPQPAEPRRLEPGQTPEIGVGYYVDVNTHCGMLVFADRWWATDSSTPLPWSTPTEGGTFTLSSADAGTFVGDAEGTKTAEFTARGPASDTPGCA